jgi:hypothetical protein
MCFFFRIDILEDTSLVFDQRMSSYFVSTLVVVASVAFVTLASNFSIIVSIGITYP